MKVLMTGGSGFLGTYVLSCLARKGIETVLIGRRRPETEISYFIETDLLENRELDNIIKSVKPTHLLHLAWYAEHGKYWDSMLNLQWVDATVRLSEVFCRCGGRQIVMAGTCAEYDWNYGYCREDTTIAEPSTLYGIAKDSARRMVMGICRNYSIPCIWGRIFIPFGYGEASQRLVPSLIDVFRFRRSPFGVNTRAFRDFLHASDAAEAFVTLLVNGGEGIFNISSGRPVEIAELVVCLADIMNADPEVIFDMTTERSGDVPLLVGENAKLQSYGWNPKLSLVQGLELYVKEKMNEND